MRWLFPLLFIVYLGGITLFTHSHVVNGVIIVHSHPFQGEHEHTETQLETILYLSSFVSPSLPSFYTALSVAFVLLCILHAPATEHIHVLKSRSVISLRAPPYSL